MTYAAYLAYAFLFVLPFERIPSFELHGVTVRASVILLLLAAVTALPSLLFRRPLPPLSRMDKWILGFAGIAALSDIFASQHGRSTEVLAFLAAALVGYLLVSRALRPFFQPIVILRVIITSATVASLFGLYQFVADGLGVSNHFTGLATQYTKLVFSFPRVQSAALEPLYFANFLLLPLFLLGAYLLIQKRSPKWHETSSLIIIATAFILTLSRGGYAGFLGGSLLLILALIWKRATTLRAAGTVVACLVISFALSLGAIQTFSGSTGVSTFAAQATVSDGQTVAASVTPRTANYKEAFRLFKQRPVLGWGIGNYGVVNAVSPHTTSGGYMIVNNQYLETLAETGILGFLALAGVVLAAFRGLWLAAQDPKRYWIAVGLAAALFGILVQYNFLSTIYIPYVWATLGLIALVSQASAERR